MMAQYAHTHPNQRYMTKALIRLDMGRSHKKPVAGNEKWLSQNKQQSLKKKWETIENPQGNN